MLSTKDVDENLLVAEFYNKDFKFSYSSLSKLVTAPKMFYNEYVLGQKDDEIKKYLLEGIVIHYLVLEESGGPNFDEKFIVSSENLPSDNSMKVANLVFDHHQNLVSEKLADPEAKLEDYADYVLDTLEEIGLHQNVKDPAKRAAKIIEPKTEEYFEFLKQKKHKTIIDSKTLAECTRRADIVKANQEMRDLLGLDLESDGRKFGVYNELEVDIPKEETGLPFGFKGIIDNLVVDVENKSIRLNDFKTTGKSLVHFEESVEIWNYWLQAVTYKKLVKHFLGKVITDEWSMVFRFIVFDKYDQLYAFEVTDETYAEWEKKFEKAVEEAKYHYTSKDYSLPYEFIKGNVKL